MIGAGAYPVGGNVESTNQQYYSQALQSPIECIQLLLDEGLGLDQVKNHDYCTRFDIDSLLKMDTAAQYETLGTGVKNSLLAPNEGRRKINLKPLTGGDTIYMQQQNFSLEALSKRDAQDNPFASAAPKAPPAAAAAASDDQGVDPSLDDAAKAQLAAWEFQKAIAKLPAIAA
jgi:phage portal protein BeeE